MAPSDAPEHYCCCSLHAVPLSVWTWFVKEIIGFESHHIVDMVSFPCI